MVPQKGVMINISNSSFPHPHEKPFLPSVPVIHENPVEIRFTSLPPESLGTSFPPSFQKFRNLKSPTVSDDQMSHNYTNTSKGFNNPKWSSGRNVHSNFTVPPREPKKARWQVKVKQTSPSLPSAVEEKNDFGSVTSSYQNKAKMSDEESVSISHQDKVLKLQPRMEEEEEIINETEEEGEERSLYVFKEEMEEKILNETFSSSKLEEEINEDDAEKEVKMVLKSAQQDSVPSASSSPLLSSSQHRSRDNSPNFYLNVSKHSVEKPKSKPSIERKNLFEIEEPSEPELELLRPINSLFKENSSVKPKKKSKINEMKQEPLSEPTKVFKVVTNSKPKKSKPKVKSISTPPLTKEPEVMNLISQDDFPEEKEKEKEGNSGNVLSQELLDFPSITREQFNYNELLIENQPVFSMVNTNYFVSFILFLIN